MIDGGPSVGPFVIGADGQHLVCNVVKESHRDESGEF